MASWQKRFMSSWHFVRRTHWLLMDSPHKGTEHSCFLRCKPKQGVEQTGGLFAISIPRRSCDAIIMSHYTWLHNSCCKDSLVTYIIIWQGKSSFQSRSAPAPPNKSIQRYESNPWCFIILSGFIPHKQNKFMEEKKVVFHIFYHHVFRARKTST